MPSYVLALDLPITITEETLRMILDPNNEHIPHEKGILIKTYQNPNLNNKYAIIKFNDMEGSIIARDYNKTIRNGILLKLYLSREITVEFINNDQKMIFVEIKPNQITIKEIKGIFSDYGEITEIKLLKSKKIISVTFLYLESALKALFEFDPKSNSNIIDTNIYPYLIHKKEKNEGMKSFIQNLTIKFTNREEYSESSIFVFNLPIDQSQSYPNLRCANLHCFSR